MKAFIKVQIDRCAVLINGKESHSFLVGRGKNPAIFAKRDLFDIVYSLVRRPLINVSNVIPVDLFKRQIGAVRPSEVVESSQLEVECLVAHVKMAKSNEVATRMEVCGHDRSEGLSAFESAHCVQGRSIV